MASAAVRVIVVIWSILFMAQISYAGDRSALIVTISKYQVMNEYPYSAADGELVAYKLKSVGYDVTEMKDPDAETLRSGMTAFAKKSKGNSIALVFLAGIGGVISDEADNLPFSIWSIILPATCLLSTPCTNSRL